MEKERKESGQEEEASRNKFIKRDMYRKRKELKKDFGGKKSENSRKITERRKRRKEIKKSSTKRQREIYSKLSNDWKKKIEGSFKNKKYIKEKQNKQNRMKPENDLILEAEERRKNIVKIN